MVTIDLITGFLGSGNSRDARQDNSKGDPGTGSGPPVFRNREPGDGEAA